MERQRRGCKQKKSKEGAKRRDGEQGIFPGEVRNLSLGKERGLGGGINQGGGCEKSTNEMDQIRRGGGPQGERGRARTSRGKKSGVDEAVPDCARLRIIIYQGRRGGIRGEEKQKKQPRYLVQSRKEQEWTKALLLE